MTNTHVPETLDITGVKTWVDNNDQDGIRPDSIVIRLLADGTEVANQTVTGTEWTWNFTGFPKYRDGGVEIVYTITEDAIDGYTTVINGYNVTNTHVPETLDIAGSKTWVDNDDQDGIRPDSITITCTRK